MSSHDPTATPPVRFIFHIGAGKTGTSSIQNTLRRSREALRRQGVGYLGLMLEHAPLQRFAWQKASASEVFHALPEAQATAELREVLFHALAQARAEGLHTLIWSNESFFKRNHAVRPVLHQMAGQGGKALLLAYVRRHDAWLRSAYVQWGIKHKTQPGPVQPFRQWMQPQMAHFGHTLSGLSQAFPGQLVVRNFDAAGDTVQDFLQVCGLTPQGLHILRDNISPEPEELLLRSLYNSRVPGEALPERFDRAMPCGWSGAHTPAEHLGQLLPTAEDLAAAGQACAQDRALLDDLLAQQGQPPVATTPLSAKSTQVDTQALVLALAEIVAAQAHKIERLEQLVRRAGLTGPGRVTADKPAAGQEPGA
ncbi:hypothetical protein [Ideonella livida]|uniref:Uncharacterized protein n=1 Tax=Ideonella livida TaxID=2707176 RepID=A0A7C9TJX0_9BURK|nr:hypothetical protein [Ideonella livida]NDY90905.1 hypothetical protein [Ideonella livida]